MKRVKALSSNPHKKDDMAMLRSFATVFGAFVIIMLLMTVFTPYRLCLSTGWSMTPTLEALNVNVVDTGEIPLFGVHIPKDIQVGDIVLAQSPRSGRYITHTVIGIDSNGYLLKGDNEITNPIADGYVPLSSIRGEVLSVPFTDIPISLGGTGILAWLLVMFVGVVFHDIFEHEGPRTRANKSLGFIALLGIAIVIISVVV